MTTQQSRLAMNQPAQRDVAHRLDVVCACLRNIRVREAELPESVIRDQVAIAIQQAGLRAETEVRFGKGCRADVLVEPGIVVEIKRHRPNPNRLQKQLERYARQPESQALIVVTERTLPVPPVVHGKPCRLIGLQGLWGIVA